MITYEEALEIAQTYDEEIGNCEEYEKTYVFEVITSEETTGPQPLVVLKETGEALPFPAFLSKGIDMGEKLGDWMIHVDLKPPKDTETAQDSSDTQIKTAWDRADEMLIEWNRPEKKAITRKIIERYLEEKDFES